MPVTSRIRGGWVIVAIVAAFSGSFTVAQDSPGGADALRLALAPGTQGAVATASAGAAWSLLSQEEGAASEPAAVAASNDLPLSFDVSYAIYSDYVFRGVNLSEYAGEGREKPNHQVDFSMTTDLGQLFGVDSGTCGSFTFGAWFEWFAAQKKLNPIGGGHNLQEVDYYLSWSYDIESIATGLSIGYTFYTYPNAKVINTNEWTITLEHNDAWLWQSLWPDNEDGVLNPTLMMAQDLDIGGGDAFWFEFGLSHEFQVCSNVTMTPSWTLGIDHNYYGNFGLDTDKNTTRFANMLWGLDITYDLAERMPLPEGWGALALSGFVYFSDALGNAEDNGIIQDEFFGGMSIGWSF